MATIELARKLAKYKQIKEAQQAYKIVINEVFEKNPKLELEAASYIFLSNGNIQTALTVFISLYNRGYFKSEIMNILWQGVYLPNVAMQKKRYKENCNRLNKYPYIFRKDFVKLDKLPILFFPYDDKGFVPYYRLEDKFGDYVNFNDTIISHNFFADLENPILAKDIFSQYELEYLNDNVRKSEWIAKENHIYLHYTDWAVFCSYLQCIKIKELLKDKKIVFLIEDEIKQYPIDFKQRFGIDYSKYQVKDIEITEINKLIWHTQLSTHNGGDFFNEIFYDHPNLLALESVMLDNIKEYIAKIRTNIKLDGAMNNPMLRSLAQLHNFTDKDCVVALFLYSKDISKPDPNSRIAPAFFFQPHFGNIMFDAKVVDTKRGRTTLFSKQYEEIRTSTIFQGFKYIKTFTPMRRITTSYAASTRFMINRPGLTEQEKDERKNKALPDIMNLRMLNRSFMVDWQDRLYRDSRLVRFEDGKLNPKATFTALAEFLDIPYTESMTYCSSTRGVNVLTAVGNVIGFDVSTVYKTYDEYTNDDERAFLEFFFRDAYQYYGYDFHYYKGESVDEDWIKKKINGFSTTNAFIIQSWEELLKNNVNINNIEGDWKEITDKFNEDVSNNVNKVIEKFNHDRFELAKYLLKGLYFVNKNGQPLRMMTPLKLDPELLEQPLYH